MYLIIIIVIVILSIFLIFSVVVQNSKGGGLAAGFSSSNQVMGVRKTTELIEKVTWFLAGSIVVLCVVASLFIPRTQTTKDSSIREQIQNTVPVTDPNAVPDFGTSVPEEESEPAPTE